MVWKPSCLSEGYIRGILSMDTRPSREKIFMDMAILLAERSTCTRAKVGAVLTRDFRIISTGYVGAPSGLDHCLDVGCEIGPLGGCVRTIHAEANTLAYAAREGISTKDTTLFVTLSPCVDCSKLLINAGVKKVIYFRRYRKVDGIKLLKKSGVEVLEFSPVVGSLCNICSTDCDREERRIRAKVTDCTDYSEEAL